MRGYSLEVILANLKSSYVNSDAKNIHYLVLSHSEVQEVKIDNTELNFKYLGNELKQEVSITNNIFDDKVIRVVLSGELDALESFRGAFFELMSNCSEKRYVIKDEVSMKLCADSYAHINRIENLFRQYIMHFMILKVGDDWWKLNVSDANKEKSTQRDKKTAFQSLINQDIYHIDFKDLLSFIYENFSAFKSKNEILSRLKACKNHEEFKQLQDSILSNKEKFFIDIFDDNFKNMWEELAELRNQIAHNKLLERKQFTRIKDLEEQLTNILENALKELTTYQVTEAESEIYKDTLQFERNTVVEANLNKLKREYNLDMSDIKKAITNICNSGDIESFTLVELVNELTGESYIINSTINSYLGYILGNAKKELSLVKGDEKVTFKDENDYITSLTTWKYNSSLEES